MKAHSPISIRHKLQSLSLFLVLTTSILGMATTLLFSLRMEYQNLDRNLMNSAQVLAQSPDVADFLAHRADSSVLTHYLNGTISRVQDIDAIVVADHNGVIRYCPDPAFVGTVYPDVDTLTVLRGELTEVDTGAGISGAEHRALAAVHDLDGSLLGFVSVGIGVRSVHQIVLDTVGCFAILTFLAAGVALVLSRNLSSSIKEALLGYEPDAFRQMFHQREDILETLKEGVIAIDKDTNVIYVNSAGLRLLNAQQPSDVLGRPLKELYPDTLLPRLLTTGKPEYNVHLQHVPGSKAALSDRMPIWEDDKIVGAVAIFQDRTEATAMAEELTGVRHLVEAMRAYTHEFINKLHIILGMIQLGQVEQAEHPGHLPDPPPVGQPGHEPDRGHRCGRPSGGQDQPRRGAGHQPAPGSQKHPVRRWPLPPLRGAGHHFGQPHRKRHRIPGPLHLEAEGDRRLHPGEARQPAPLRGGHRPGHPA